MPMFGKESRRMNLLVTLDITSHTYTISIIAYDDMRSVIIYSVGR